MIATQTVALKEWGVVIAALSDARDPQQIVIFRKGGIREEQGRFRTDHQEFLLYPTYEHQATGTIRPECSWVWSQVPPGTPSDERVIFTAWARLTDIIRVDHLECLVQLSPSTVWTPSFIEQRFRMLPIKPLYVLFLRVYRLPDPYTLDVREGYRGCKSWVSLASPVSLNNSTPILPDDRYQEQSIRLKKLLNSLQ